MDDWKARVSYGAGKIRSLSEICHYEQTLENLCFYGGGVL